MRYLAAALAVSLFGCVGEITSDGKPSSGGPDAPPAIGDARTDAPPSVGDAPAAFACRTTVTAGLGSGNHHPGEDCQGACHNHGFTLGGTVFTQVGGATPYVGATITVVDAAGKTIDVVSQRNGNFYTSQPIAFPVTVTASACPNATPMISKLNAGQDGCNQGGCHVAGAQGVIHLP